MKKYDELWRSLTGICSVSFCFQGETDRLSDYGNPVKTDPYGIYSCSTEYNWKGIRFTAKKEYFGASNDPKLLVFRQTIEPFSNCDFDLQSGIELSDNGDWMIEELLERENNSCGLLLKHRTGFHAVLTETTQVTSVSFHVDETRTGVIRDYHLIAFEECPIRVEKYLSLHTDEDEDYIERAFMECRGASKLRFDELRGRNSWDPDITILRKNEIKE